VRYTVTAPCPASGTLVIPGLRGTTWTLTGDADSADLFEVTAGGARLAAAACVAATDSVLTFTTWRGERKHGLLMRAGGNPEAADRASSWGAAVPPRGQWLITVEAVPVRDGSSLSLHYPRCQPVEHARAACGGPRGNGMPGQAVNTPPRYGQRWGGS
jgi:hypothetical protein